jgi:hypothetical protein
MEEEEDEDGDGDDDDGGGVAARGGNVELVHQKPLRSITNKKRTRRLSIQELRRKFWKVNTTDR